MRLSIVALALFCLTLFSCKQEKKKILVFSKTAGFRHESIPDGKIALIKLGKQHNIEVDTTENAAVFTENNLKQYDAIVFLSTTGDLLDPVQQADFKRYIEAGGGFVGIHSTSNAEQQWPWFGRLVGALFKGHPEVQQATLKKAKPFGENDNLPDPWTLTDEWYNYKRIFKEDINVIYNIDESSYKGGEHGNDHPIVWYHEYEGGRSFYTAMGHTKEIYQDTQFLEHLWLGIDYAMGDGNLNYNKVKTKRAVEENRFAKTVLEFNLNEPTEMTILPDGKIIFVERRGDVKLYTPADGKVKLINKFNVWTQYEDGIIGITSDPNFKQNNWLYVFYSHPDKSVNVLSRFEFKGDSIDTSSEKQMLEIPVQRETCCHTGGSLTFDADGNLLISTGDNTSPFEANNGYSPCDERPGREPFDAQKSASNTNDLRGKILRIHPQPDATYTIPNGNLFKKGEPNTRAEIYIMGCRNPYRITTDPKTKYVYWGDVGPDAGQDDPLLGARGYDEINQAKQAGFFGWPYFIGNNYSYGKFDFKKNVAGLKWDVNKPVNTSPNNTGLRELPKPQPALIWYPYATSDEFPVLQTGSRNAMVGPFYYSNNFKGVETAFPDYLDGKLLIYDWMRNSMFLVTLNDKDSINDIEPFLPNMKMNSLIDMAYGPDGRLYVLEYGTGWFKQNIDASLSRIDFNKGNRPPVAMLSADRTQGASPLTVHFSTKGTIEPDGESLTYELSVDGKAITSKDGIFKYTFDKPGVYKPMFKATDSQGLSHTASIQIVVGNEPPLIKTEITKGNKMFFLPGVPVQYKVHVSDKEDGSTDKEISADDVTITFDFLKGYDMTGIAQGHQQPVLEAPGKTLMSKSDCKSCHIVDQLSAGPAYKDVAKRYKGQKDAVEKLAEKIIKGGAGVWGTTEMSAHPQISLDDARKMVDYILSLGEEKKVKKLPLTGTVIPAEQNDGVYYLTASYVDQGRNNTPPIPISNTILLRPPTLKANEAKEIRTGQIISYFDGSRMENLLHGAVAGFKNIDMTNIKSVELLYAINQRHLGGTVEFHVDSPKGKLVGTLSISTDKKKNNGKISIEPSEGVHDFYVVFNNEAAIDKSMMHFIGLKLTGR